MGARYYEYVTKPDDRWDLIAWEFYRNVDLQTEVIAANRRLWLGPPIEVIPAILPAGLTLRIPVLDEVRDDSLLPPWKRGAPTPDQASGNSP